MCVYTLCMHGSALLLQDGAHWLSLQRKLSLIFQQKCKMLLYLVKAKFRNILHNRAESDERLGREHLEIHFCDTKAVVAIMSRKRGAMQKGRLDKGTSLPWTPLQGKTSQIFSSLRLIYSILRTAILPATPNSFKRLLEHMHMCCVFWVWPESVLLLP